MINKLMHGRVKRIVVGSSLRPGSDRVVQAAKELADRVGAELYLIHATATPLGVPGLFGAPELPEVRQEARQKLDEQIRRIGLSNEDFAGLRVEVGCPQQLVLDYAVRWEADLVVLGAAEQAGLHRLLGSTVSRVIRKSPVPVLVLRDGFPLPPRRVVLAVDLSPISQEAMRCGVMLLRQMAGGRRPQVEVVTVVEPNHGSYLTEEQTLAQLAGFIESGCDGVDLDLTPRVLTGDARDEILAEIDGWTPDLLVVGSHGSGGFERFLIGSVAEHVSRRAACSVLVVPPKSVGRAEQLLSMRPPERLEDTDIPELYLG